MKELKELRRSPSAPLPSSGTVESGEGIESPAGNRGRSADREQWNPVKELKVDGLHRIRAARELGWNPVKELKAHHHLDLHVVLMPLWNPVKELKVDCC